MPSEDSKPVVKNEMADDDDLDDRSLSSIVQARRKNPTNAGSITPKSRPKLEKSEKEEDDFDQPIRPKGSSQPKSNITKVKKDDDDDDEKPISKRNSASKADKKELDIKKVKKNEGDNAKGSSAAEQNEKKKKEKKVYDLPGQRRDPPEERDPLRIFYETLYEQVPNSEMAQFWMMESGLLPKDLAQKVYDNKLKKRNHKLSSPMKRDTPTAKKTNGSTATKKNPTPASSAKSKTVPPKVAPKESKKRKANSDSDVDSDDDFVVNAVSKKQKAS